MTDTEFLQQIKDELPYENSAMQSCTNRLIDMIEERERKLRVADEALEVLINHNFYGTPVAWNRAMKALLEIRDNK